MSSARQAWRLVWEAGPASVPALVLLHGAIAAMVFSPFILHGHVLSGYHDVLTSTYAIQVFAKQAFENGTLALWNPHVMSGIATAGYATNPLFAPENWPLFMVPDSHFFRVATFLTFIKLTFVGVFVYLVCVREIGDRRWAFFAAVTYQLSYQVMYSVWQYEQLNLHLWFTALLYLIWSMDQRRLYSNYILLSGCMIFLLLSWNMAYSIYAMLLAGTLFLFRTFRDGWTKTAKVHTGLFAACAVTALLVFAIRVLPSIPEFSSSLRAGGRGPQLADTWFLLTRLLNPEMFGTSNPLVRDFLTLFKVGGEGEIAAAQHFFGVIPALLAIAALLLPKARTEKFWVGYCAIAFGMLFFLEPFDYLARILLFPIYHSVSLNILGPIGFAMLAGLGGRNLELALRAQGHNAGQAAPIFPRLAIALTVLALCVAVVFYHGHVGFDARSALLFKTVIICMLGMAGALMLAYHKSTRLAWRGLQVTGLALGTILVSSGAFFLGREEQVYAWLNARFESFAHIYYLSIAYDDIMHGIFRQHLHMMTALLVAMSGLLACVCLWAARRTMTRRVAFFAILLLSSLLFIYVIFSPRPFAVNLYGRGESTVIAAMGIVRFIVVALILAVVTLGILRRKLDLGVLLVMCLTGLIVDQIATGKKNADALIEVFYPADSPFPPLPTARDPSGTAFSPDFANFRMSSPVAFTDLPQFRFLGPPGREDESCNPMIHGIRSFGGIYNMVPKRYLSFVANWYPEAIKVGHTVRTLGDSDRFLDLVGAGYRYDAITGIMHKRDSALSRFMLFTDFEFVPDDAAALERLKEPGFNPLAKVLVDSPPKFLAQPSQDNGRRIDYVSRSTDRLELRVDTGHPALLVFNDSFHAGWKITVNGVRQPLVRANYNFMAVTLKPGANQVILNFAPRAFYFGVASALAGLLLLAVTAIVLYRCRDSELARRFDTLSARPGSESGPVGAPPVMLGIVLSAGIVLLAATVLIPRHHRPGPATLVEKVSSFNILKRDGRYFGVPAGLDSSAWGRPDLDLVRGVFVRDSRDTAVARAKQMPNGAPSHFPPILVKAADSYNIVEYNGAYYGLPHSLGRVVFGRDDLAKLPGVLTDTAAEALEARMEQAKAGQEPAASLTPRLVTVLGRYNIVSYRGMFYGVPQSLGEIKWDEVDAVTRLPGVIVDTSANAVLVKIHGLSN